MSGAALGSDKGRTRRQPRKGQLGVVAYERIRQMILECDLPPGAPVSQSQLESTTRLGRGSPGPGWGPPPAGAAPPCAPRSPACNRRAWCARYRAAATW